MRLALILAVLSCGLAACNTGSDPRGSGLAESFNTDNYSRSNSTNGTQRRPDVNRLYTQPSLPSIANRGF